MKKFIWHNKTLMYWNFEEVYAQYRPLINSYIRKFNNIPMNKTDLAQEIDIIFWKGFNNYRYDCDNVIEFKTFIINHLDLCCKRLFVRKLSPTLRMNEEMISCDMKLSDESDNEKTLLDLFGKEDFKDEEITNKLIVDRLLRTIDSRDKEIIKLFMDGYTFQEIGMLLNCSAQAVNSRFNKLLPRLKTTYILLFEEVM